MIQHEGLHTAWLVTERGIGSHRNCRWQLGSHRHGAHLLSILEFRISLIRGLHREITGIDTISRQGELFREVQVCRRETEGASTTTGTVSNLAVHRERPTQRFVSRLDVALFQLLADVGGADGVVAVLQQIQDVDIDPPLLAEPLQILRLACCLVPEGEVIAHEHCLGIQQLHQHLVHVLGGAPAGDLLGEPDDHHVINADLGS